MQVNVIRKKLEFAPDPSRIIARFLYLNDERSADIIRKVLAMPEKEVNIAMSQLLRGYSRRHRNISRIFEKHFDRLAPIFDHIEVNEEDLSFSQKALIGSYFTMEYSIESAAFESTVSYLMARLTMEKNRPGNTTSNVPTRNRKKAPAKQSTPVYSSDFKMETDKPLFSFNDFLF